MKQQGSASPSCPGAERSRTPCCEEGTALCIKGTAGSVLLELFNIWSPHQP